MYQLGRETEIFFVPRSLYSQISVNCAFVVFFINASGVTTEITTSKIKDYMILIAQKFAFQPEYVAS